LLSAWMTRQVWMRYFLPHCQLCNGTVPKSGRHKPTAATPDKPGGQ
jgi:hypothetical protein